MAYARRHQPRSNKIHDRLVQSRPTQALPHKLSQIIVVEAREVLLECAPMGVGRIGVLPDVVSTMVVSSE